MNLTFLSLSGAEPMIYFNKVLSREGQRIGHHIQSKHASWKTKAIVPEYTPEARALRFEEGGIVNPSVQSSSFLANYVNTRRDLGSLVWEDPWLIESDIANDKEFGTEMFYYGGCVYFFLLIPKSGVSGDLVSYANSKVLPPHTCMFLSSIEDKETILDAPKFEEKLLGVCISSYDDESFVLFEKQ